MDIEKKKQEECLAYFQERPVYRKLFQKMKEKYESLGHMGGKVVLTGLGSEDKRQLGGFLQKDYTENKTVTVSVELFEKCLAKSRFSEISMEELLQMYFGSTLTVKKEEKQKEIEKRTAFFEGILGECGDTLAGQWMQNVLSVHGVGYELLLKQYREDSEKLREIVRNVAAAVRILPGLSGEFGESFKADRELLPVFAAKVTGDPHYFDMGTVAERLLSAILSAYLQEEKETGVSETERKNQLFYRAGILKDDLSNDTLVYGIRAWKQNGELHEGVEGFFRERESVRLTLRTIGRIKYAQARQERIYLLENPAVFSVLVEKNPDCAAICVNGQPRLATLVLLDMLKENHSFYYGGDYDPEGLLIAQRMKERYGEGLSLWNYCAEWYYEYLSEVSLSEVRMKKLEKVHLPELQELKACMEKVRRAAYQETMMEKYVVNS